MSNETTISRLLDGENVDIEEIRAGTGEWFDQLDESITEQWGELPDQAKVIAYLWGVESEGDDFGLEARDLDTYI